MTLIKSISGIRGTIGGKPGTNLTPQDVVLFVSAYGSWLKETHVGKITTVLGRDARISGPLVQQLAEGTLNALGIDVIDLGLATTPTVEMAVIGEKAQGGIIFTASHNPGEWNALKLLNNKGEFISGANGNRILQLAASGDFDYAPTEQLGKVTQLSDYLEKHIEKILALELVNKETIQKAGFTAVVDGVNSVGGIAIPRLLEVLGVNVIPLYCEPTGRFAHNPEPLAKHLTALSETVVNEKADLGIAVDPDADRLAFVNEDGSMFGEEYTLVACADYVLGKKLGVTVSNMSSSRALRDLSHKHGQKHYASAVGEVNVVVKMKENNAVIGGEGNGGIIYPPLHYGRDALVGIALFLMLLAERKSSISALRSTYPVYFMSKDKIKLEAGLDVDMLLEQMAQKYKDENVNRMDGLKIDFASSWVHLRKSNTEPIIRIYSEARSLDEAKALTEKFIEEITRVAAQV